MDSTSEPLTHPPAPAHSPECRKWFLAFTAAKQFLISAQRTCPACLAKHPPASTPQKSGQKAQKGLDTSSPSTL
jgi:hypothetical protein